MGDKYEGFREAEGIVLVQKSVILSGEKRARELLAAIEKLGDPPDASEAKKNARRRHQQSRNTAEKASFQVSGQEGGGLRSNEGADLPSNEALHVSTRNSKIFLPCFLQVSTTVRILSANLQPASL